MILEPIWGRPILSVEKTLVFADLHLGIEYELLNSGISVPSQTNNILREIISSIREFNPMDVVFLGDIKHNIPMMSAQERREIPKFFGELSDLVDIYVVKGNHDGNLIEILPRRENVFLYDGKGFSHRGVGFFHGHAHPSEEVISCKVGVMAHNHPVVKLTDGLRAVKTLRVWVRAPVIKERLLERYDRVSMGELLVMPAFNDLCGGMAVNVYKGKFLGPLKGKIRLKDARAYLLDGTDLGHIF